MKRLKHICIAVITLTTILSCSKSFLEPNPQGELTFPQVESREGVEGLLIGSYSMLNGNIEGLWASFSSAPSQWLFGDVAADNAHKGSNNGDQPNMNFIEQNRPTSTNDQLEVAWNRFYEGITRCNNTLRVLADLQAGDDEKFDEERAVQIQGETRLLRAHYYFMLKRLFVNVPWVDEGVTSTEDAANTPNDSDISPMIEEDLRFAIENLTEEKYNGEVGRVNLPVAQAYLGKFLLYQQRHDEALPFLQAVIDSKPDLAGLSFTDNYDITAENGPESIFEVQHGLNPDGSGDNANTGDMLNFFYGNAPINCCGFLQPSFDLVNAFRVDDDGLPMLDGSYRDDPYLSDFGLTGSDKSNYQVDRTLRVDPRLDYTVGRRGVPFRDWGTMPGDAWIRDPGFAGPFVGIKHTIEQAQFAGNTVAGTVQVTGLNVKIIRLADVYLMAAECKVELGDLPGALELVNAVRSRAANLAPKVAGGSPVADYDVQPYQSFPNAEYARNAVRFERRLELALEGHRFYDLVRWGVAQQVLDSYSGFEGGYLSISRNLSFQPQNEYYPIPQTELDRSGGILTQNSGY
ncbi:RagB/SusD family nutrient uptake outer membrane protein [Olivibacter sp. SDN3]|uniref:RagB/SusD family nutrient uptake outer membrane protein n=1 Tax=Olivibacter sp. SDN3 TaxID=2764720 RepID=UPI001651869F|nr:RagB/SusD family nutrient uptake outer membrane protein [Olivibacter sp. SDN3]QNL49150.1 RagB/SusD family nutrient uptake outer membrane protein [Olivibacter sp. SDN3]